MGNGMNGMGMEWKWNGMEWNGWIDLKCSLSLIVHEGGSIFREV